MVEVSTSALAREQYRALMEMRWTLFVRGLRDVDNRILLVVRILFRLVLFAVAVSMAVGAGFGVYYGLKIPRPDLVLHVFWWIFGVWQMYVLVRSSLSHGVGRNLLRFPLRFRTYITLWMISGLTDTPTLLGAFVCLGAACGASLANIPAWAALGGPGLFFCVNVLLSRLIFLWSERLMANRHTREFVLILFSLIGLLPQLFLRTNRSLLSHIPIPPFAAALLRWTPPIFVARSIGAGVNAPLRATALLWLAGYCIVFAGLIGQRLRREYRGEDLHESAASVAAPEKRLRRTSGAESAERAGAGGNSVPLTVLGIEFAKMRHSGQAIYQMLSPLVLIVLFGWRMASHSPGWLLPGGVIYLSMDLAGRTFNCFGTDGAGVQIYRLAPVSMRSVFLGKNLYAVSIFAAQSVLLLGMAVFAGHMELRLSVYALAFAIFAVGVDLLVGNQISLRSPRRTDVTRVTLQTARTQRRGATGGGWRALLTIFGVPFLGVTLAAAGYVLHQPMLAPAAMIVLALTASFLYWRSLERLDNFDPVRMERALTALVKTQ
jgi:ABC-2 type transport system permease protein